MKRAVLQKAAIARQLVKMGYEKNYQVEAPGQFSVRGGIVDIFDLTRENPVRIELWGDEVESIRSFDIESQRSIEKLTEVSIYPATELILSKKALEDGLARMEKDCKKSSCLFQRRDKTGGSAQTGTGGGRIKGTGDTVSVLRQSGELYWIFLRRDTISGRFRSR